MEPEHTVHPAAYEQRQTGIGAEGTVAQQYLAPFQFLQQFDNEYRQFVHLDFGPGEL